MRQTKTSLVAGGLRVRLEEGEFSANELLTEGQIASEYGVSITPAREALNQLCTEGIMEKVPHKGYLVKGISFFEVQKLFEFRRILDYGIMKLAISNASAASIQALIHETERLLDEKSDEELYQGYIQYNTDFHIALAESTGNPFLAEAYSKVMQSLRRAMAFGTTKEEARGVMYRHIERCRAILKGDESVAEELFMRFMKDTNERITKRIR